MSKQKDKGHGAVPGLYLVRHDSGRAVWTLHYRDQRAQRTRALGDDSKTFGRAQARALARSIRQGSRARRNGVKGTEIRTVGDLVWWHWKNHTTVKRSEKTASSDYQRIEQRIVPYLGHVYVDRLEVEQVAEWHNRLAEELSPATANRCLAVLSVSYTSAVKRLKIVQSNPCRGVERFREVGRERFLSEEEYDRLFAALDASDLWEPAIECIRFIAFTGMRAGEATNLTWDRVDLEQRVARFDKHGQSKGGKGVRPLNSDAVAVLEGVRGWKPPGAHRRRGGRWGHQVSPAQIAKSTHCFPSRVGRALCLAPYWQKIRTSAAIEDVRIHDLRHSFCSRAARQKVNVLDLQRIMGHKDLNTTNKYYHLDVSTLVETAEAVTAGLRRSGEAAGDRVADDVTRGADRVGRVRLRGGKHETDREVTIDLDPIQREMLRRLGILPDGH